jgi:hypothetical protein
VAAHGKAPPAASHYVVVYVDNTRKNPLTVQRNHFNELLGDLNIAPTNETAVVSLPIYKLLEEVFMLNVNSEVSLSMTVDDWIKCMDKNNPDHNNALAEIPYGKLLFESDGNRISANPDKLARYIVELKRKITRPRVSPRRE